jgi:hypothetical protein
MRQAKTVKTEVDLLKPVTLPEPEPGDCFGSSEYDPRDKDCSVCADLELCGLKREVALRSKKKKFEEDNGPLLDQTDFQSVNWDSIYKKAIEYEDSGEPMTFQELTEAISTIAKTKDQVAVAEFINREMPKEKLELKEGNVYARR